MAFEFLTTDAFLFWVLIAIQSAVIIWFVEAGNAVAAGTALAIVAITLFLFPEQWDALTSGEAESASVGSWLLANVGSLVTALACYVLIGLLWATFRWWLYVNDAREAYEEQKLNWLQPRNLMASAKLLENRAAYIHDEVLRARYLHWANTCRAAAATSGGRLSQDLRPVWKEFVENGYQF